MGNRLVSLLRAGAARLLTRRPALRLPPWLLLWLLLWAFVPFPGFWGGSTGIFGGIFGGGIFSGAAYACDVIVVKSDALPLYDQTVSGMESTLPCKMTTVFLPPQREQETIASLGERNPDAIIAVGTYAFRKLKSARVPNLVYTMAIPYESDTDLADNIPGVGILIAPDVFIGSIVEVFGPIKTVGVLYHPGNASGYAHEVLTAARARGIEVVPLEVQAVEDVPVAFRELRSRPDVLLMLPDPAVASPEAFNAVLLYSFQNRVPLVSFARKYVSWGAVLSLEVDPYDIGVQTGELVGKIIRSGKTFSRKVYARKVRLTVNKKVAQKMSLSLREAGLRRAEIVR
ncbi:MAG: ABC transporter substrate binding protein [Thermodesulfovibrionales bacterium]